MNRYRVRFTVWGNPVDVSVFADSADEAADAVRRRYGVMDEESFSVAEEKEDVQAAAPDSR